MTSAGHTAVAVLLLAGALATWPSRTGRAAARLGVAGRRRSRPEMSRDRPEWDRRRRRVIAVGAGVAVGVLLGGGWTGLGAAAVVVVGADRFLGVATGDAAVARVTSRALQEELPAACELLAVCLEAGIPVPGALAGVGEALPGPLGEQLSAVAGLLRLGAEPRTAWSSAPPELAAMGRVLVRAGESGSTVTGALRALSAEGRAAARVRVEAAVQRAGVWVLAPLGLCFLPAFLCLGVVPLVLGIAGNVFR